MAVEILVPPLSQTMDTLVLVEWLKRVGDPVVKGEVLFTVETDKSTLEVESPASGVLQAVYAQPNDEVAVRSSIGLIAEASDVPAVRTRIFISPRARRLLGQTDVDLRLLTPTGPRGMIVERDVRAYLTQQPNAEPPRKVTPVARRMAEEHALDLDAIAAQSAGPVVKRADVAAALETRSAAPSAGGRRLKLSALRRTIAQRLQAHHQAAVPVTLTRLVDATALKASRERLLAALPQDAVRPSYTDLLLSLLARCLLSHRDLNATFDGETLEVFDHVHLGLAVDTERGLLVPVIRSAETLRLSELAARRMELVSRAQAGLLKPDELTGGSFTLTNLGAFGVDTFTPVLNPPQAAILGVGRIYSAPAAYQGQIMLRDQMHLSLTFDHRVVDGAPAARLLADLARYIETPELLWW